MRAGITLRLHGVVGGVVVTGHLNRANRIMITDKALHFTIIEPNITADRLGRFIQEIVDDLDTVVTVHRGNNLNIKEVSIAPRLIIPGTQFWRAVHNPYREAVVYTDGSVQFWYEGYSVSVNEWIDAVATDEKEKTLLKLKYL